MNDIFAAPKPPVIEARGVSMAYRLYKKPIDMLKEAMFGGVRHDTFWAIRDISLEVHEGERLGIVGHNGAGKSTLLQIIAGNLKPTTGSVSVNGRISSLLSMVPAWNGDENGIKNIRFNLLVQGVPESRIPRLTEEIIDFTELGPFISHPVKTYSSGMSARLAFAIATAIEPEILIVDEVLGAGDGYFAGKAYKRMQEFCARGKALLFVSHATSAVQQMCNTAVWIHNGIVRLRGDVDFVLKQYELDYRRAEDEALRTKHIAASANRLHNVGADEIPDAGYLRFRLVAAHSSHFGDTHYVSAIRVHGIDAEPIEVELEFADQSDATRRSILDVLGSEWGRIHERNGVESRLLTRATGRRPGGQFMIKLPADLGRETADISVEIESSSDGRETLKVELLDMAEGRWRSLTEDAKRSSRGAWRRASFSGPVTFARPDQADQSIARISENALPDVEILGVHIEVDNERAAIVRERQPFDICVHVLFRRAPEIADIAIKFSRADGIYVFWQSSGHSGVSLTSPGGEKLIRFRFAPNDVGAGEYYVDASVNDGWLYPQNYPFGQIFARVINAAVFRVAREMPEVDFGILNARVEVQVSDVAASPEPAVAANS